MTAVVQAWELQEAMRRVRHARAGLNEDRATERMQGVGIRADETWATVWATNGYRLAEYWISNHGDALEDTTIPRMYADSLERLLRDTGKDELIDFHREGSAFWDMRWKYEPFPYADGAFPGDEPRRPGARTVFPLKASAFLPREELLGRVVELKKLALMNARDDEKDGGTLRLTLRDGNLTISPGRASEGACAGVFKIIRGLSPSRERGTASIAVNPLWLKQALEVPRADIWLEVYGPEQPLVLLYERRSGFVPMRSAIMPIQPGHVSFDDDGEPC